MKKILFATTALVATASVAAADVTFSGYGRFGVKYTGSVAQSAANAAAIAEQEARLMANIGGTDGEITIDELNPVLLGDQDALAADDVVDTSTDPFTTSASALAYANATRAAEIARSEAMITALKGLTATSTAKNVVYDPETGKASLLTDAEFAALTIAPGNAITILDVATADDLANALVNARSNAQDLSDAEAEIAAFLADLPATIATDAILSDTLITSRLRMNIDASTESDSGVTFGVRVRVQQDEGNTNAFNSARFYAKSGGLELGVGNIYGVIDNMAGLYAGSVGLTGLGWGNVVSNFGSLAYSSGGAGSAGTKEAAEVIYSMGDYGFAVATDGTDTEYGVSATMSGWTVALSASDTDTAANSEWVATVGGSIGGVKVGLATAEAVNGDSSTTLSAAFDVAAATSVTVYYNDDEANTIDDKSYGLGVVHGLGGGASLRGGIVSVNDRTLADFGVLFNF